MYVPCRKLCAFRPWRFIRIAASLSVLSFALSSFGENMPAELLGGWRLVKVYKTDSLQGLSPREIQRKLLGTIVVFRASSLTSCGQTTNITSVVRSRIFPGDLLFQYHVTFESLGITSQTVDKVVLNNDESGNCLGELTLPGEEIYLKSHDEICVNLDGAFFKAVRIKSKAGGTDHMSKN